MNVPRPLVMRWRHLSRQFQFWFAGRRAVVGINLVMIVATLLILLGLVYRYTWPPMQSQEIINQELRRDPEIQTGRLQAIFQRRQQRATTPPIQFDEGRRRIFIQP